jgi:chromosome segregation ATPase
MSEGNSLENTAELNFKFQEASSELSILRSQYVTQSLTIQKLEEELLSKQSSIESLKLALNYNSSYEISKEIEYKNRIEELEKNLKVTRQEKESLNTNLTKQISHKDSYIENLLTTMLNLHQKIEYYKEDISQAKKSLDNQKKTLEIELVLREKVEKLYQESLEELEKYKKTYIEMKHKAVETDVDTEELFKNLKSEYEHEYVEETIKLAKNYEAKLKENSENYNSRILLMEKTHKEVMENLTTYMQHRLENMRNHYEKRILSMIKEYSLQEAKVQSKIANLSLTISTFDDRLASLQGEVIDKTSALRVVTQERKSLEQQNLHLDQYILSFQLENQVIIANIMAQLEQTKRSVEVKQEDLKKEYDHNLKLLQQSKSIKIESIRTQYERKLKKLSQNHEENSEKARKFHQDQCNFLLDELSKLEAEKTNLAIKLEHDVRELKKQLDLVFFI